MVKLLDVPSIVMTKTGYHGLFNGKSLLILSIMKMPPHISCVAAVFHIFSADSISPEALVSVQY